MIPQTLLQPGSRYNTVRGMHASYANVNVTGIGINKCELQSFAKIFNTDFKRGSIQFSKLSATVDTAWSFVSSLLYFFHFYLLKTPSCDYRVEAEAVGCGSE